jgi:hypothetical protein
VELNKNIEQQLAVLLAEPNRSCLESTAMLKELLEKYPYYQPLHLLLAKANLHAENVETLAKTSLYTNGQLLHQFLFSKEARTGNFRVVNAAPLSPEAVEEVQEEPSAISFGDDGILPIVQEEFAVVEPVAKAQRQEGKAEASEVENAAEKAEAEAVTSAGKDEASAAEGTPDKAEVIPVPDEQETFEEIAEVDINNYRPFRNYTPQSDAGLKAEAKVAEESVPEEPVVRKNSLEGDFLFESIASSDFFAFESNFSPEPAEQPAAQEVPVIEEHDERAAAESVRKQVSNYHDDKLPYTFLWWLDKTRKAHQHTFQPYAPVPKKETSQELQQQYVEHIFHIQSHLAGTETLLNTAEPEKPVSKDFKIIDSFIKNDPQITPPNAEQIDNENKAKKSAEDQNDLVSETLANIYIEQMLYDKAIDTYEKLSLKFPEKSRYFADLIQSIEKKI